MSPCTAVIGVRSDAYLVVGPRKAVALVVYSSRKRLYPVLEDQQRHTGKSRSEGMAELAKALWQIVKETDEFGNYVQ